MMGKKRGYSRWTEQEESTLRTGVLKYGEGKWKRILADVVLSRQLSGRTNVDLKDKWRTMASGETTGPRQQPGSPGNFGSLRRRTLLGFEGDDDTSDDEELVLRVPCKGLRKGPHFAPMRVTADQDKQEGRRQAGLACVCPGTRCPGTCVRLSAFLPAVPRGKRTSAHRPPGNDKNCGSRSVGNILTKQISSKSKESSQRQLRGTVVNQEAATKKRKLEVAAQSVSWGVVKRRQKGDNSTASQIWKELSLPKCAGPFRRPVALTTEYTSQIRHPMDLKAIRQKLEKDSKYNLLALRRDVALIIANAMVHAKNGSEVYRAAILFKAHANSLLADRAQIGQTAETEARQRIPIEDLNHGASHLCARSGQDGQEICNELKFQAAVSKKRRSKRHARTFGSHIGGVAYSLDGEKIGMGVGECQDDEGRELDLASGMADGETSRARADDDDGASESESLLEAGDKEGSDAEGLSESFGAVPSAAPVILTKVSAGGQFTEASPAAPLTPSPAGAEKGSPSLSMPKCGSLQIDQDRFWVSPPETSVSASREECSEAGPSSQPSMPRYCQDGFTDRSRASATVLVQDSSITGGATGIDAWADYGHGETTRNSSSSCPQELDRIDSKPPGPSSRFFTSSTKAGSQQSCVRWLPEPQERPDQSLSLTYSKLEKASGAHECAPVSGLAMASAHLTNARHEDAPPHGGLKRKWQQRWEQQEGDMPDAGLGMCTGRCSSAEDGTCCSQDNIMALHLPQGEFEGQRCLPGLAGHTGGSIPRPEEAVEVQHQVYQQAQACSSSSSEIVPSNEKTVPSVIRPSAVHACNHPTDTQQSGPALLWSNPHMQPFHNMGMAPANYHPKMAPLMSLGWGYYGPGPYPTAFPSYNFLNPANLVPLPGDGMHGFSSSTGLDPFLGASLPSAVPGEGGLQSLPPTGFWAAQYMSQEPTWSHRQRTMPLRPTPRTANVTSLRVAYIEEGQVSATSPHRLNASSIAAQHFASS